MSGFLRRLLIAIDDSAPSQYAIGVGLRVAQVDGSPVTFAVVLDPSLLARDYGFVSVREMAEQIAEEIVANAVKKAQAANVSAESKIIFDQPSKGIIDLANSEQVGLIVMGTHGRTGIMRALIRSIAEEVLRRTTTPLCVVRRPPIGKIYQRLLVPITDDGLADDAVRFATEAAKAFTSHLLFCTVASGQPNGKDEALLDRAKNYAVQAGVQADSVVLPLDASVAKCILKRANAAECDAIIMPSHGRDGLSRLTEGSIAEDVIRSSDTPVVVLRWDTIGKPVDQVPSATAEESSL